jgi:hypothetical protein
MSFRNIAFGFGIALFVAPLACGSSDDSGSGGSSGKGGTTAGGGSGGKGGTSAGGTNAGGTNAGGTNAGGTNAGGTNAGGTNAGGTSAGGVSGGGGTAAGGGGTGGGGNANIKTVFIILMENHDWSSIKGSSSAPYLNSLLAIGAHAENYHNVPSSQTLHPSEPNYVWLEAGDNLGIATDAAPSASNCAAGKDHLVKQLKAAGVSWRSYQEDIAGGKCPLSSTGNYAPKHNPQIFFDDVSGTGCSDANATECVANELPYTQLAADLGSGSVGKYNFITPNQCHDMHSNSCAGSSDTIKQGDDWLKAEVPKILASSAYTNNGAIFITWDEGGSGNKPIGMIVLSPLAKVGFSDTVEYSHSSTLRTMQTIFGVGPFLNDAAKATDLGAFFTAFP